MNPRHRRLLIPGLLAVLVVVVVISSLVNKADALDVEPTAKQIGVIDDARVTEASGLAISRDDENLGYVVNDSGNVQAIYAVDLASGDVVGTTVVTGGTWQDTEALSIDDHGTLWVADTGDNLARRDSVAVYSLPEPGRGDHTVAAQRFQITYSDGAHDVETLLIDPRDDAKYLVSKGVLSGGFYRLPAELTADSNTAEKVDGRAPGLVTDGAFAPDGTRVLLRTYGTVYDVSPDDWSSSGRIPVPRQEQGESLATEPRRESFVIGTEGRPSPMIRVALTADRSTPSPSPEPSATPSSDVMDPVDEPADRTMWWVAGGGALVLAGAGALLLRRRH